MTAQAKAVLQRALNLDALERAELIDALFRSFGERGDPAVDAAWEREIASRVKAFRAGKIKSYPAATMFRRIGKR